MDRTLLCAFTLFIVVSLLAQDAQTNYSLYCAGCHGAQMEGSLSSPLIKEDWTYGRRKWDIRRNIKFGIPGTEMIAWGMVLDDNQVDALADLIYQAQDRPPDRERPLPATLQTSHGLLQVTTWVGQGLEDPWSIEFIDADRALVSGRKGKLWQISGDGSPPLLIAGTPPTHALSSTGGYMDLALDPDFGENGWVYLGLSHVGKEGDTEDRSAPSLTKIVRGQIEEGSWVNEQTLFQVPDELLVVRGNRWGCRLMFDREGLLYFTIGDMAQAMASQDLGRGTGKVFRIAPDGSIPADNPFVDEPGALPAIFTIGNRNVQGLALDPTDGKIWATEHGPMGGDELNILEKGKNYGWPLVTHGVDYSGEIVSDRSSAPGMVDPVHQWTPSNGICPLTFVDSRLFPDWKGNLIAGALAYEELIRLQLDGEKVQAQEILLKGYGRVRDVKFGPTGDLFVVLNRPDKIIRIRPAP